MLSSARALQEGGREAQAAGLLALRLSGAATFGAGAPLAGMDTILAEARLAA